METNTLFTKFKQTSITLGSAVAAVILSTVPGYSSEGAFGEAAKATEHLQGQIVDLAKVLFPFSLVCLIIAILFTHDQKALQFELKTALIICVAYIALLIVTSGTFLDTFTSLGISP